MRSAGVISSVGSSLLPASRLEGYHGLPLDILQGLSIHAICTDSMNITSAMKKAFHVIGIANGYTANSQKCLQLSKRVNFS